MGSRGSTSESVCEPLIERRDGGRSRDHRSLLRHARRFDLRQDVGRHRAEPCFENEKKHVRGGCRIPLGAAFCVAFDAPLFTRLAYRAALVHGVERQAVLAFGGSTAHGGVAGDLCEDVAGLLHGGELRRYRFELGLGRGGEESPESGQKIMPSGGVGVEFVPDSGGSPVLNLVAPTGATTVFVNHNVTGFRSLAATSTEPEEGVLGDAAFTRNVNGVVLARSQNATATFSPPICFPTPTTVRVEGRDSDGHEAFAQVVVTVDGDFGG